jgi:nucleotide-binding universal stress UspA family protein
MYQRIFVPIDTSDTSSAVLEEVRRLAHEAPARVCLVKVVDAAQFAESPGELIRELREKDTLNQDDERHASLQRFLEDSAAGLRNAGIEVETRLIEKFGHKISHVILDEAMNWKADLLVMGTHGRSGLAHLLLGSVAEEVLHHITIPMLLVKLPADDSDD